MCQLFFEINLVLKKLWLNTQLSLNDLPVQRKTELSSPHVGVLFIRFQNSLY